MILKLLLFSFSIFFTSTDVYSAPIAVKCSENNKLEEVIYPPSFLEERDNYISKTIEKTEASSCIDCVNKCSQSVNSPHLGLAIGAANKSLESSLKSKKPFIKVSDEIYSGLVSANQVYESDFFCSTKKPRKDQYSKNGNLALYYPYHNNYMYITGCNSINNKNCNPVVQSKTLHAIEEAVIMGVDPYMVLAAGFMENGTSGAASLYLDPVGTMDIMGCKGRQLKNTEDSDKTLNSYGTIFEFKGQVVSNKKLGDKLTKMMSHSGVQYDSSKISYLCRDVIEAGAKISAKPISGNCCLKLPFSADKNQMEKPVSRAFTNLYVGKQLKSKFRGQQDPAYKIQRFNGYTDLMGGAEEVPTFRAGLNFYEDPSYGYQAMDYIFTSLMSNPIITDAVEMAQLKHGSYSSAICSNLGEGSFVIDSEYYFKKHASSVRFDVIRQKLEKGEELTDREKQVFHKELQVPEVAEALFGDPHAFDANESYKITEQLKKRYGIVIVDNKPPTFESYYKNLQLSKAQLENQELMAKIKSKYDDLYKLYISHQQSEDRFERISDELSSISVGKLFNTLDKYEVDYSKLSGGSLNYSEEDDGSESVESVYKPLVESIERVIETASPKDKAVLSSIVKYGKSTMANDALSLDYKTKIRVLEDGVASLLGRDREYIEPVSRSMSYSDQFSISSEYIDSHEEQVKASNIPERKMKIPSVKKLIDRYIAASNSQPPEITNEIYEKYFKEVYPKRRTVKDSSDYSWERLSESDLEKVGRNFSTSSN